MRDQMDGSGASSVTAKAHRLVEPLTPRHVSKTASNAAYEKHEEGARTDLVWAIFPKQKEDLGCGVDG